MHCSSSANPKEEGAGSPQRTLTNNFVVSDALAGTGGMGPLGGMAIIIHVKVSPPSISSLIRPPILLRPKTLWMMAWRSRGVLVRHH